MAPLMLKAAVNAKVNFSMLYVKWLQAFIQSCIKFVAGKLSGHKVLFSLYFFIPWYNQSASYPSRGPATLPHSTDCSSLTRVAAAAAVDGLEKPTCFC